MWCIFLVLFGDIAHQTDWMGGDSVLGPVNDWGTQYWMSDSVTAATPGQVSLIATQWNYLNWVKHVVESNSGIPAHAQGLMPADVDGDGILDLVAHSADQVVWYKHDGYYNFSKNVIGPADDGGIESPCVYPFDLDQDGDIDVLVATEGVGVGWYENQNLSWVYQTIDNSISYHRVSATDVELDGDLDVIAIDNGSGQYYGDIYLFRDTTGTQDFKKKLVADLPSAEGWRVYPVDFTNDGYPDIYSGYNPYVFLNDSTGVFSQSFHADFWIGPDYDGIWPSDIDRDGDMDLVCGVHISNTSAVGFYGFLNDGTGSNFNSLFLAGTETGIRNYGDGSMALDMDLDGLPDIAGTYTKVGWFRQDPLNPLTFNLWSIDSLGTTNHSHWVYAAPLGNKCTPSIDLLVTGRGVHIVYENNMLIGFASLGEIESSILELTPSAMQSCTLKYFAYNACVPIDTTLCFYWRAGADSAGVVNNTWNGPYYATVGMNIVDSFVLSGTGRMFQYKAEFRKAPDDIAVLYEIWLTYNCPPFGVEEIGRHTGLRLQFMDGKLVLYLPQEDRVGLAIYDIAGRLVKNVFDGYLPSGMHEFEVSEKDGIYFAVLRIHKLKHSLKIIKF